MTARPAVVLAVLAISACSSSGPPPVEAPSAVRPEVTITIERPEPAPPAGECGDLAALVSAGDHKPAVDLMAQLHTASISCPLEVIAEAEQSRLRLRSADDLIRQSTAKKRAGEFHAAKEDLRQALEIYPKYYWAQKLLRDLGERPPEPVLRPEPATPETSVQADLEVIRTLIAEQNLELARLAEQQGDLGAAHRWALQALKAEPDDPDIKQGLVEYARLLGLKFFSAGELTPARELWTQALSLDRDDARLNDYLRQVDERLENLDKIRSRN